LRDAIAAVGRPTIEVHLTDIRRREPWRRRAVLKDVCVGRVVGKGVDSYLIALRSLAGSRPSRRAASRAPAGLKERDRKAPPSEVPKAGPSKTIGRRTDAAVERAAVGKRPDRGDLLTRAAVRQKIAERLAGKLTPSGLATWARKHWLEVQRGAPAES